jgi:hypothetical protein
MTGKVVLVEQIRLRGWEQFGWWFVAFGGFLARFVAVFLALLFFSCNPAASSSA